MIIIQTSITLDLDYLSIIISHIVEYVI